MTQDQRPSVLIVDDEPLARSRLRFLCEQLDMFRHIELADGGQQALEKIDQHSPDILLLDVDMPDLSGMDVAAYCGRLLQMPEVIFTTAHSKYAVDAFRLEATDYLLKPVKEALLRKAVERAKSNLAASRKHVQDTQDHRIWVQDGAGSIQINSADIIRVEAERDYMRLCLDGRSYLVHESMQSLEDKLPKALFIRVHRSAIVRRDSIKEVRRNGRRKFIILTDGSEVSLGPSYAAAVIGGGSDHAGGLGGSEMVTE